MRVTFYSRQLVLDRLPPPNLSVLRHSYNYMYVHIHAYIYTYTYIYVRTYALHGPRGLRGGRGAAQGPGPDPGPCKAYFLNKALAEEGSYFSSKELFLIPRYFHPQR